MGGFPISLTLVLVMICPLFEHDTKSSRLQPVWQLLPLKTDTKSMVKDAPMNTIITTLISNDSRKTTTLVK